MNIALMSLPKILNFSDVYKAGEMGEGVDRGDMPVAFWVVDGPGKPVNTWMDQYAGLDRQTHNLLREGAVQTEKGPIKKFLKYQVQSSRIRDQPNKWGVVVSNVTPGNVSVKGLLRNVGKQSNLKDLFGKLWEYSLFLSPYPGVSEECFKETKMERRYREGRFEVFTKPEKSGWVGRM